MTSFPKIVRIYLDVASSSGNSWDSFVRVRRVPSPPLLQRKPRVQELPEEEANPDDDDDEF